MRKVELISEVKAALMIPERLEELLYVLDSAAWQTFRKAAESSRTSKTESHRKQMVSDPSWSMLFTFYNRKSFFVL